MNLQGKTPWDTVCAVDTTYICTHDMYIKSDNKQTPGMHFCKEIHFLAESIQRKIADS